MQSTLGGKSISLIALEEKYLEELFSFSTDPVIWEHLPLEICTMEEMRRWYDQAMEDAASGKAYPFLIRENSTGKILGSTRILRLDDKNKRAEIGFTWLNPLCWGSKVNTESKLLLMRFAFYTLKLNRVQFRADERNLRSRRAILKLGAVYEATLRNFKQRRDGSVGNVFLFSIISSEWPGIEKNLQAFLDETS